jgi:hypothetical protein
MKIYTVTTVCNTVNPTDIRCWGYYLSLDEAASVAESDKYDLNEAGYWFWIVIEAVSPGIYSVVDSEQYWYLYSDENRGFVPCTKPDWAQNVVGWGIG